MKYIILTHAHIDHSYYLDSFLAEADGSVSVCHVSEESLFYDTVANVSEMIGAPKTFAAPDMKVSESDTLSVGGKRIEFIHTPGHTPGGMCIYVPEEKIMFTGDTLFCNGFGRTDLGGSARDLAESIKKLYTMDTDITILPGHGCSSTIGEESAWGIPSVLC
ncbi:MAG: MBL fold metallo-hydrolase [Clostridia bacterium]|nr:MBL fold metallo-hydrolase [Clostridia bacterium]